MEILLVASGAYFASQLNKNRSLALSLRSFLGTDAKEEDVTAEQLSDAPQRMNEDGSVKRGPQSHYYPDDRFYNRISRQEPLPERPNLDRKRRPATTLQPDMMEDVRQPRAKHVGSGATPFRPSWVRNTVDEVLLGREEREREWSAEVPRGQDRNMATFQHAYKDTSIHTLNQFGQGGLPFDDQIRVRPDGLDPVASQRKPTARYNTYALGEDLTLANDERVRGAAAGQNNWGLTTRQEGWELNPDRDMQMQPCNPNMPLNGAGIRSGGRGAPLACFVGAPVEPLPSMRGNLEREPNMTGNKGMETGPVRPSDDPLDKRFLYEHVDTMVAGTGAAYANTFAGNKGFRDTKHDPTQHRADVDMNAKYQNVGMRDSVVKPTGTQAVDKTAWKFSYDLKKLFDMPTATNAQNRTAAVATTEDIRENVIDMKPTQPVQRINLDTAANNRQDIAPEKRVLFSDAERNDFRTGTAHSKRREADFQPQAKNTGTFRGVSVFKSDNTTKEVTSNINTNKKIVTQLAAPTGANLSGRTMQIKKSGATTKRNAQSDGLLYDNDEILERAGMLAAPQRAPKGTAPDYTQAKVSTTRNAGEFRRR
jgi:hypothetical protein